MTALVTGAGKRLGRALALEAARLGHDVAVHYHGSAGEAEAVAQDIRALGRRAVTLAADLLDDAAAQALLPRAVEALGAPVTLLVNNASIFEPDSILDATTESWDRHINSNLKAPFWLIQAFGRQGLRAEEDESGELRATGLIVNMIDQRVLKPTPEFMTYTLAKMGLWALTRTTAQALAPAIRVNAIGPGPTLIGLRQRPEHFARQRQTTVLRRGSNPSDVTAALRFLAESPGVTGQLLCTDAGQHLAWQTPDALAPE